MIKEGFLRKYARSQLQLENSEIAPDVIEAFLSSGHFGRLSELFDKTLLTQFADFCALNPAQAEAVLPLPATEVKEQETQQTLTPLPPMPTSAPVALRFHLQNARAGAHYAQAPAQQTGLAEDVVYEGIEIPADIGLHFDLDTGLLTGIPQVAGEFTIKLKYRLSSAPEGLPLTSIVDLTILPDPKSMWKNIPSDPNAPFWKADEDCSSLSGTDFRLLAASKRGRSHAHVGSFRDDDYRLDWLPASGWYIAVVSDGAGSARFSRRGSQLICSEATAWLKNALEGEAGQDIVAAVEAFQQARCIKPLDPARVEIAYEQLRSRLFVTVGHSAHHAVKVLHEELTRHPSLQPAIKDFSSTAIITVCRRFAFGTLCVAFWVGDGAVAVYSKNNGVTLLGEADSGEFSGQTRFLDASEVTATALTKRIRFVLVDEMEALILMTDGVSDPMFDTEANLERPEKWHQLWQQLQQDAGLDQRDDTMSQRLLSWLDFWSQGNHDDRTLALILQEK